MDTILGIDFNGGVVLACDQTNARSILLYQTNLDKIKPMTKYSALGVAGPQCDAMNFSEYLAKNWKYYEHAHPGTSGALTLHAQAHFMRNEMAEALRSGPFQVNVLLGGIDPHSKESALYFMDYLAALQKVPFGAQGYAAYFCLSIMDREYKRKDITTEQDAIAIIHKCIHELRTRMLLSQPNFLIKVIDANGIRVVSQDADPADT